MYKILVIEDDSGLNRGICFALEKEGYAVLSADTLRKGYSCFRSEAVDFIILDLNLPDGDGLDFCKEIRMQSNVPLIMLTARDMETDEIIGLESGADDYIKKPFSLAVLKARIQRVLREREANNKEIRLVSGDIVLYPDKMKVEKASQEILLSTMEFRLLKYFMDNKEIVLLKEQIMDTLWDQKGNFVEENTLPVTVSRLRKKLEDNPAQPSYIKTVHGMGYLFHEVTL